MGNVDFTDVSFYAAKVLEEAKMTGVESPNAFAVAEALNIKVKCTSAGEFRDSSRLVFDGGQAIIRLRDKTTPLTLRYLAAEAIGHWCLVKRGLVRAYETAWCKSFAGTLLAPERPLRAAWETTRDVMRTCRRFPGAPPTSVAWRLFEAGIATSVYVLEQSRVRYALGKRPMPDDLMWANADALCTGRSARPGLRAGRLPDGPGRVAVVLFDNWFLRGAA
jgi:hypothetical protein